MATPASRPDRQIARSLFWLQRNSKALPYSAQPLPFLRIPPLHSRITKHKDVLRVPMLRFPVKAAIRTDS